MAPQATWECCADDVEKIEYEARVPSGFDDPVRWVVRDDPSGVEHASTACDVTQAVGGRDGVRGRGVRWERSREVRRGEAVFGAGTTVFARKVHDADRWNRE